MRMQFGTTAFEPTRGGLPQIPVFNMYAEEAPTEETGIALQSRPPLIANGTTLGSGPVQTLFVGDGVLGGVQFAVSGGNLYEAGVSLGAVAGTGPYSIAGYEEFLFVAGGGSLFGYDGATLAAIAFPDSASVIKVLVGASRAIALRADSETYYWSDPLEGNIDALDFTSAETRPDRLRDALFIDDTLILFGAETTEFHANTPDADLPFTPIEQRVFEKGIRATGCAVGLGSSFAWVTNGNQVCIGDPDNIVSNQGLEARIKASTEVRLWTFLIDAGECLALTLDDTTYVRHSRSGMWSEFDWEATCFAADVFGSADGSLLAFGDYADLGATLERRLRAGFPLNGGGLVIDNVVLRTNSGGTPYLSGDYTDPAVEMRLSKNGGETWGEWRQSSLGRQGQYRKRVQWLACGMAGQPGLLAEFRVTAPVDFRVSDVLVNEPFSGI